MSRLPRAWKNVCLVVIRAVMPLFYDRRYLRGAMFDEARIGWIWALHGVWQQKILGFNRSVPWPINPFFRISNPDMIEFDVDDIDNFQSHGCYFQNFAAKIHIGKGTRIAPNVGIITANHDTSDPDLQAEGKPVRIGRKCWIGMNAVILPGVTLGDHTVVGAGAVVSRSFPEGHCIVAGSPARVIRQLNIEPVSER